jgi:hypothetical protein
MAENKTKETDADVSAFVDAVADPEQREDARTIISLMSRISGHPAKMWGASIIGFGTYHYRYDSGREGDMCRIGFSPRKGKTVLYIVDGFPKYEDILSRIGKHKTGVSCLYIKKLSGIDAGALEELIAGSWSAMQAKYPE